MDLQREYDNFMMKLWEKVQELNNEYNNLSNENKIRVAKEVTNFISQYSKGISVIEIIKHINNLRLR